MSHKTGKRVLTASTSLALAVVGLAASPLAAHAATSVDITNVCGGANAGGFDYLTLPADSTTYQVFATSGNASTAQAVDTTPANADPNGTPPSSGGVVLSADGKSVYYYIPATAYGAADAQGVSRLGASFAVYGQDGQPRTLQVFNGPVDTATCAVPSYTVPVAKPKTGDVGGTITVTKGTGIVWSISAGSAVVTPTASFDATSKALIWPAGSGPDAQIVLTVADDTQVDITATPAGGYTGTSVVYPFILDGAVQLIWVPPVTNDRDGVTSDTVTLSNLSGVTYYYTTDSTAGADAATDLSDAATAKTVADANTTGSPADGWVQVPAGTGSTLSITRPAGLAEDATLYISAVTDPAKYKFDEAGLSHKEATTSFKDYISVNSIPAPTMVDGPGSADYYVVPQVAGVKWVVSGTPGNYSGGTYNSNDARLGTQIPVVTTPGAVDTYTFTAMEDDSVPNTTYLIKTGLQKTWTAKFDNRASITPAGPTWIDETGLVNDAVKFPGLSTGLNGYQYALTTGTTQPADNDWKPVDGAWYGNAIKLLDLQQRASSQGTHVWVKASVNTTSYLLAQDANGNPVPTTWDYTFTNAVNVVPAAPVQTMTGNGAYTLTFPTDATVIYSVTDANGVTKNVAATDLGKALPYSGTVTVTAKPSSPAYVIQPNADGTAPAPWVFNANAPITPQAPTADVAAGTYTLPAQTGIVWNVDGKDVPLSEYGKAISANGLTSVVIVAQAGSGYTLQDGAQVKWTLDLSPAEPTNAAVDNDITSDAPPTAKFTWSADGATSYDVTYHKTLLNGSAGPEIEWLMDTTETSANFVAEAGDEYTITVVAKNAHGDAQAVSSTVTFLGGAPVGDVTTGQGTFSAGWNLLGKSALSGLPYYGDTAALASNGATWTYTVPAGTKSFDLFATVHQYGSKGKIWVNGVNWADFETNPSYWGTVSNPYGYPVRRVQGWDNTKSATITVQQTEGGNLYLALDAYRVNK